MMNLGELDDKICVECGKQAYQYRKRVYKLCDDHIYDAVYKFLMMGKVERDKLREELATENE